MAVKLKTKVALGGIFLFALLILVGAVSYFYFNKVSNDAKTIVKDNYETLNYSRDMLNELDRISANPGSIDSFESKLRLQEHNITESGEKEATTLLRKHFELLKSNSKYDSIPALIRANISDIMQLNLQAIDRKNQAAQLSSEKAKTIITIILTLCLLVGFTFLYNFPSLIAGPISKLTEGIKAIANRKYSERIHLNRKDEFGELAGAFNTMAERLDEYDHSNLSQIMFEKQRAETVINSLKDASIGIDSKGRVLFANQQALQLLSLNESDILGLSQEEVKKRNDLFRFLVDEQSNVPFKIVVDGKENYFIKEIIELKDEKQNTGLVIVLKNITSFKELDVAKTNFIATISHELKTPLASSDLSLKLLEDERIGQLSDEQKELLQSLRQDNQRMLRILSELLNMSQVEAGKIQLDIAEVKPEILADNAVHAASNTAKGKKITIQKDYDTNMGKVRADSEKTGWVLNNYLTNAIKHSPEGGTITVSIKKSGNSIEFFVSDQGPGISSEYSAKVFERFFKVPGSKAGGTGLGLAISKELIEAQSGQIWVKSEIGSGSTFGFNLPSA